MNEAKFNKIIKLSETIGRWYNFLDNLEWNNPNLLKYQEKLKKLCEIRKKLLEELKYEK